MAIMHRYVPLFAIVEQLFIQLISRFVQLFETLEIKQLQFQMFQVFRVNAYQHSVAFCMVTSPSASVHCFYSGDNTLQFSLSFMVSISPYVVGHTL